MVTSLAGRAIAGAALSFGLSFIARKLAPKPKTATAITGAHLSLRAETNVPRQIAFGETATAGSLVYWNLYGGDNEYLQMVFALAEGECDSLTGAFVNGEPVTVQGDTTVDEYPDVMWIEFHNGAWDQAADSELVAHGGGRWTANDRGRGVCYVRVTMKYDEAKFPGGRPKFLFQFKGAKLYDWRKDDTNGGSGSHRHGDASTYEWSANPVVAWYNWRRGIWLNGQRIAGMNTPGVAIDHDAATAAANICDESVALKVGGSETRYVISGLLDTSTNHRSHIENILGCMAGEEYDLGGTFRIMAGAAQSPVLSITDDDLLADAPVKWRLNHSADKLTNAFFGAYVEPAKQWNEEPLDPRLSSADETADGGDRLEARYDFPFISSNTQGQRVLEALRRQARRQQSITAPVKPGLSVLEAGDWISWTSERYGFTAKLWAVESAPVSAEDHTGTLTLREIDADVYAWVPATDEITPGVTQPLPSGGPSLATVSGLAVANATVTATGGAQRPGLRATWTPITDPTVDAIKIQYRKVGDTDALSITAPAPSDGAFLWLDGVQGGLEYEIRAIPMTTPQRALSWTAWVQVPDTAADHVVDVAALAQDIPPDSIDKDDFVPTLRSEVNLITAEADVDGSIAQARRIGATAREDLDSDNMWADIAGVLEQFIEDQKNISEARRISVRVAETAAAVTQEQIARADGDTALAALIDTLTAVVNGNTASISSEAVARASADGALSALIDTLTAAVNNNTAAVNSEAVTRASADTALAASVTSVEAKADQGTANGYFKIEAVSAPAGVAARLAMFANAGTPGTPSWEEAGIYIDVVSGVGSQIFLKADKVSIGDGTDNIVPFEVVDGVVVMKAAAVDVIEAGIIRSADQKMVINLTAGSIQIDD
ncbi:MAG: hypothetical protein C0605_07940 [Hyphomicrobiales bacterium]|nr:MAG: hypothetical protein C0605_07940 [Hyphomicrobiales bacterium]